MQNLKLSPALGPYSVVRLRARVRPFFSCASHWRCGFGSSLLLSGRTLRLRSCRAISGTVEPHSSVLRISQYIDTVAKRAREEDARVVFIRNRPVGVDGDLDEALRRLLEDA